MLSSIQGFPRLGAQRELKFAVEAYWKGEIGADELQRRARELRAENRGFLRSAGLDLIPVGDFSFYDKVLDTCCMVDAVPSRFPFAGSEIGLDEYFALGRGIKAESGNVKPLSMMKWYNTNYHYMVPEFGPETSFSLRDRTLPGLVDEALEDGMRAMPVLLGPVSFLLLGRMSGGGSALDLLDRLLPVYEQVVGELAARGVEWIQLDEPSFAADRDDTARQALGKAYSVLAKAAGDSRLVVQTYFDSVGANYEALAGLPVDGLGLDFVHGTANLELIAANGWPGQKTLFAGVVDGRNVWAVDPDKALGLAGDLKDRTGGNMVLSTSCSLMHVPVTKDGETHLPEEVFGALSFAREKVSELVALARALSGEATDSDTRLLESNREAVERAAGSRLRNDPQVRSRMEALTPEAMKRSEPYEVRSRVQKEEIGLPLFPTTTIGSFPQTRDLRRLRAGLKKGELTGAQYTDEIRKHIIDLVDKQQDYGLDVLVHGEFERNDMVEYFGEQLEGYCFTRNGWVLSYGSRGVKPPVIYGDVSRPGPMTVEWSSYAASLTGKPMKGMLTGPVTMLNWSFVRDDIPRRDVCWQIALAIRDEVADLEKAGIRIVQIDEPALREGLPLQKDRQADYLAWAVDAFRISASSAAPGTQVHSHMCYSDFNTIYEQIIAMDADVISIENSRAGGRLLEVFRERQYPNGIGPGVWDIHSPLVPTEQEIVDHLREVLEYLPAESVWVNPDCGLKTRSWKEVEPSLRNMVNAARRLRREHGSGEQG